MTFDDYDSRSKFVEEYVKWYGYDSIQFSVETWDNTVEIDF